MIKKLIQKIKCSMPFSLNHFWHENVVVVRNLSDQSQLIQCQDCGKLFAINHSVRVVLPWEKVKAYYDFMESLTSGRKPCALEGSCDKSQHDFCDQLCSDYRAAD
jgi:transcription elongation factor Elf1